MLMLGAGGRVQQTDSAVGAGDVVEDVGFGVFGGILGDADGG